MPVLTMIPHWTDQRDELETWLATEPRVLIGCDFDGTLAPLVPMADQARLPERARETLQQLAELPGVTVAVISGRSLKDVIERVNLPRLLYAGNHGLEMRTLEGSIVTALVAESGRWALQEVLRQIAPLMATIPGAWVEDKHWTASVHYRQAQEADHARLEAGLRGVVRDFAVLSLRPGKRIWEIRPETPWHKGSALGWCMGQCKVLSQAAAFLGDDISDHDAFAAVTEGWSFLVGDTPAPNARARLEDVQDSVRLLQWMAEVRMQRWS